MWYDQRLRSGAGFVSVDSSPAGFHEAAEKEATRGGAGINLSPSSVSPSIWHAVEQRGSSLSSLFMSVYLLYQSVILPGQWGREGRQRKGCKLIRFLSLHAPLPVLLLSNPGGQRYAAQRLASQTQWGNNWYKQHLADETLSVFPSNTFLLSLLSLTPLPELSAWFRGSLFIPSRFSS